MRILKGFIAHQLPWTPLNYDAKDLLAWLKPFGMEFTKAFLAAGKVVAQAADYVMSADAISGCALAGDDPPYETVWDQIVEMQATVDVALTQSSEDRRRAGRANARLRPGRHPGAGRGRGPLGRALRQRLR